MRILFIISLYPPYVVGGNEMITHDLVEALREKGHDVHVLTARGSQLDHAPYVHQVLNYSLEEKEALFQGGKKLSPFALFHHHIFDLASYRNVRRVVQQLEPDLIVADNLYMASAAPLLAVRDMPCPVMAQTMDKWLAYSLVDWGLIVKPRMPLQKLFVRAVQRLVQPLIASRVRLDGMATVSNFVRDFYIEAGFDPDIMQAVYLGYNSDIFRPGMPHPLNDPVQLIFAGALWEGKGPQVIVQALEILSKMEDMPRFHLSIYGDGSDGFKRYLDQVIRDAGVEDQVSLHGFVPWERLVDKMHQADIFVFSSIWDEPFATVPLQALACGTPLVATRAGGTPEGFVDGETALLVPANDAGAMAEAIARLVRDEPLRHKLRKNGIRSAQEQWTFDAYVKRFLGFSQRVIEWWQQD